METADLKRRIEDLALRCERANIPTATPFLAPAEQAIALAHLRTLPRVSAVLFGGDADCERKALFFLPDWLEQPEPDAICALHLTAHFGTPGHRDYLGALLGMGVRREWLGDLRVDGQAAWVYCLPSVVGQLLELEQVGRVHVQIEQIPSEAVPPPVLHSKALHFTVQSPRLDAMISELFSVSRSIAARQIAAGAVSLNGLPCLKADAAIREGDVLSLRGAGKGKVLTFGGLSRKGRLCMEAERYV